MQNRIAEIQKELHTWGQHHEAEDCSTQEYFAAVKRLKAELDQLKAAVPGLVSLKKKIARNLSAIRPRVHYKWFAAAMRETDNATGIEPLRRLYAGWQQEQALKLVTLPDLDKPKPKPKPMDNRYDHAA